MSDKDIVCVGTSGFTPKSLLAAGKSWDVHSACEITLLDIDR